MKTTSNIRVISLLPTLVLMFCGHASAQPTGGKSSGGATTTATTTNKPKTGTSTAPAKTTKPASSNSAKTSNKSTSGPPASIDGKWWTSGNDFGDSEVVFSQTGSAVSGVIRYSDGRTGTVSGTMAGKRLQFTFTSSSSEGGSGWLELSWNNFLGGPWRNQRVRDGSWTLMRVEGKWCFGGSRSRIRTVTHNARGDILMVTEDGSRDGGRLEGPWLFLESDGMTIKGEMDFRANRVNWSSGFFWTWCGRN
ncbi:MAG TPA: hypothetical protein VJT71_15410 [Pyrinomonadaceae bacterium]|nr:hypothetical protein [Pyrinomonadaceae bacterium]